MGEIMSEKLIKQPELFEDYPPECVFTPKYPQTFKFNLIVGSNDFGELMIKIDKDLELSEVKGGKKTLEKLEEIGKKQAGKAFYYEIPSTEKIFISYPFKNAGDLVVALFTEGVSQKKGVRDLRDFVSNVENPINYELLYKKTGIVIDDY